MPLPGSWIDTGRHRRERATAQHEGTRTHQAIRPRAHRVLQPHLEPVGGGLDSGHSRRVADVGLKGLLRPIQVIVELLPGRKEALLVDEVRQPSTFGQVVDKGVVALGVPQSHQIFEEGHLHPRPGNEHAPMPPEPRLCVHELGREPVRVLGQRYRQGKVRRPEPDTEHIMRPMTIREQGTAPDAPDSVDAQYLW
ncbi:Uncharacterised protein [Mycobacteroides abscessus subsp. abscessus]|nr:Uncharacterised protein [Mycobacteroides abscessus subsp. abscessus]